MKGDGGRVLRRAMAACLAATLLSLAGCGRHPVALPAPAPISYRDICPRWSPTGDRIAFLRRWSDGRACVVAARPDLSHPVVLTQPAPLDPDVPLRMGRERVTGAQQIAWSPDGRRIAYPRTQELDRDDGEKALGTGFWVVDAAGGTPHELAAPDSEKPQVLATYRSVSWSPIGDRIAFIGRGDMGDTALFIRPLRTPAKTDPPLPRFDSSLDADLPAWSPDGRFLAFRHRDTRALTASPIERLRVIEPGGPFAHDIWLLTPAGYAASGGSAPPGATPQIVEIAWAPDSARVAVTLTPDPGHPAVRELWIVAVRGAANPRRLPGSWIGATWIGRNRLGAVRRRADGALEAAVIDAGAGAARAIAAAPSDDFDWSPDGKSIVFGAPDGEGPAASRTLRVLKIR